MARSDPNGTTPFTCRPADLERDRRSWLVLRQALWPECAADEHLAEMEQVADDREASAAFVALAPDGTLIGLAEAAIRPWAEGAEELPVVHLEGWVVAEAWRRRGVGRALTELVERWGRDRGAREFTSDAEVANDTSQAAHRALGFVESCRIVCYRRPLDTPDDPAIDQDSDQS